MESSMDLDAQEFDTLLNKEPRSTSRLSGSARIASAVGACILVAVGGKAVWGGTAISERDVIGASEGGDCSKDGDFCGDSLCCSNPDSRCWRKNAHWASCNVTCDENMKWEKDGWVSQNESIWACEQLSPAHDGENCMHSRTCANSDSHCFQKNEHWASCNKTCNSDMKWVDGAWTKHNDTVWDCFILSAAEDGMNCMESKTCKNRDSHCFLKNEHWASCNASCSPNNVWNHSTEQWEETTDPVWNCKTLSCVDDGANCMDSRCCKDQKSTCFKKDEHWASCNATCTSSYLWTDDGWKDQGEGEKIWDCEELLPENTDDTPPCDVSGCDGCQGEQCTYCREEKERDCCLQAACEDVDGDEKDKCPEDNLEACCDGKSERCKTSLKDSPDTDETDDTAPCDVSECDGCQGEQCTYCREDKERDCCLEAACKDVDGDKKDKCPEDNLETCCDGKSKRCEKSFKQDLADKEEEEKESKDD